MFLFDGFPETQVLFLNWTQVCPLLESLANYKSAFKFRKRSWYPHDLSLLLVLQVSAWFDSVLQTSLDKDNNQL